MQPNWEENPGIYEWKVRRSPYGGHGGVPRIRGGKPKYPKYINKRVRRTNQKRCCGG